MTSIQEGTTERFSIWKRITLGKYRNVAALRDALVREQVWIGDMANQMLDLPAFRLGPGQREVALTRLSVGELGFGKARASFAAIYARALQLNLELCFADVAPQLRLQYPRQPIGEFLLTAMVPLIISGGNAYPGVPGPQILGQLLAHSIQRSVLYPG